MKIIVTGSLGNIGKPLTKQLIENGNTVTVVSSNTERKSEIEALGASAAIGTLEDAGFLASTFKGADAVFAMVPPNFAAPDSRAYYQKIGESYAQALNGSGVKRVVDLSSWGADLDHGTGFIVGSHDVEQILNRVPDVAITHLRPTSFYSNLYSFIGMIKHAGIIGTNYGGDVEIALVAQADIARVAAEEIQREASGIDIRYIASDDVTLNQVASALGAAIGKPDLKWMFFSDGQTQAALEQTGMPAHNAAKLVELNASINSGKLREDYDLHRPVAVGKVKLADFAKEFAAAYHKA